jgi:uncharacterized protein YjbI with pentapeptide repeats
MANEEHLTLLERGVKVWNTWREENRHILPDLRQATLRQVKLPYANLSRARLWDSSLSEVNLSQANFYRANLSDANLSRANLSDANLSQVDLHGADLRLALLNYTNLKGANLTGCKIYGISAWNINLTGAQQADLVITPSDERMITVDNLQVAQFIYLLLRNEKLREVIGTITSKAVLILGRFTPERKVVLNAIREELRKRDRLPILFDFTAPTGQTLLETVLTLAHMARFVIADLTDAKSILQELTAIVPYNPTLAVQPIILASQEEPGMWDFFRRFPWVLKPYRYHNLDEVRASLEDKIIAPAALKAGELLGR